MIAALSLALFSSVSIMTPVRSFTGAPNATFSDPFSAITGVRELPGGRAIVVDGREGRVVLLDFGRRTVAPIGRPGRGPGEYQMLFGILPGPGTSSYLPDPFNMKIHVVSGEGRIQRSISKPSENRGVQMPVFFVPTAVDSAGRLYLQRGSGGASAVREILRWDLAANQVDRVAEFRSAQVIASRSQGKGRGEVSDDGPPFTASPVWRVLPDGRVVIVHPSPYHVEVRDGARRLVGPTRSDRPIPVTAAERAAYRAAQGKEIADPIPDRDFPAVLPPFLGQGSVLASPSHEIWVLRTRAAADPTPRYDIFDATGKLVATAVLRPHSRVVGFGTGTVYVARQDPADDLWYLERYSR